MWVGDFFFSLSGPIFILFIHTTRRWTHIILNNHPPIFIQLTYICLSFDMEKNCMYEKKKYKKKPQRVLTPFAHAYYTDILLVSINKLFMRPNMWPFYLYEYTYIFLNYLCEMHFFFCYALKNKKIIHYFPKKRNTLPTRLGLVRFWEHRAIHSFEYITIMCFIYFYFGTENSTCAQQ